MRRGRLRPPPVAPAVRGEANASSDSLSTRGPRSRALPAPPGTSTCIILHAALVRVRVRFHRAGPCRAQRVAPGAGRGAGGPHGSAGQCTSAGTGRRRHVRAAGRPLCRQSQRRRAGGGGWLQRWSGRPGLCGWRGPPNRASHRATSSRARPQAPRPSQGRGHARTSASRRGRRVRPPRGRGGRRVEVRISGYGYTTGTRGYCLWRGAVISQ